MATAAWINYRDNLKCYKACGIFTLYTEVMTSTGDVRVSQRGQMSLPASARHRWGLDEGGEVGYLDIGDAVILVPGGVRKLRRELLEGISEEGWKNARSGFGDQDLANE
jgi:bifunctional DNA-binding transcriptional regulator/antitoxin component of YhaV-PrlF toxin-antitoxin module